MSKHHMLWPRRQYHGRHEKALRGLLVVESAWEAHCELHAQMDPPAHPDRGITLTLLDDLHGRQPLTEIAPLYAIDRLLKLGSMEAITLADHLTRQLGHLGVTNYEQDRNIQSA